jgi:threonine/homoserine/homoserine lactone efflux protein
MPELSNLAAFALIALGMVLTPGPNMIYLISRSLSQGPMAGLGRKLINSLSFCDRF